MQTAWQVDRPKNVVVIRSKGAAGLIQDPRSTGDVVLSKTGRGMLEVLGKTRNLPEELRPLLTSVDGRKTLQSLCSVLATTRVGRVEYFQAGFKRLIQMGYVRIAAKAPPDATKPRLQSTPGDDLDFTAR